MSSELNSTMSNLCSGMSRVIQRADNLMDNFSSTQRELNDKSVLLKSKIILEVGTGKRFANLEAALNEAARYKALYAGAPKVEIILKNGYQVSKNLIFSNGYYGYITLSSESAEVEYTGSDGVFIKVLDFASAPVINTIFKDPSASKKVAEVAGGSLKINANKGFKNFLSGISCASGFVSLNEALLVGCQKSLLYTSHNGFISAYGANLQNFNSRETSNKHNIYCGYGSMINAAFADVSNSVNLGVNANGGYIMLSNLSVTNLRINTGSFIYVFGASTVNALGLNKNSITFTNGANFSNIALNTYLKNGVVLN